jgi:asparagine synthase (glutamine-hydrolysing)
MCGIWSFIQLAHGTPQFSQLFADFMNMKPRGPDMTSFQTMKNLSVGFHRLAIMNPKFNANQPYIIEDGDRTIMFCCNGEIYNFQELINDFNLSITDNSDCMTIPLLYLSHVKSNSDKNGIHDFVNLFTHKIKGEYAFMLFEFDALQNLKQIICGRDHIGIRPLYIGNNDVSIMFSSEIKGMMSYKGNVKEFEPGTIMQYYLNTDWSVKSKNEYDFKIIYDIIPIEENQFTANEMMEKVFLANVRNALTESVKRRLTADKPIAFLLSGGLDSSLVCGIATKLLNKPINTYCCGIANTNSTDIKFARTVAEFIKSNHTEVLFTIEDALASIPEVIRIIESYDVTTIRASVGQYMVSKYISENSDCPVVITGELSDEVANSYMFNYYAPNGKALHNVAKEYVKEVHMYDGRRVDRCLANMSCEARIPFSDPEYIFAYWQIPSNWRHPKYKGCEKWWLRKAFEGTDVLNTEVLYRRKEAFSDGISGTAKSWFQIIQEHIETLITYEEFKNNKWGCVTKEQYYYRKIFVEIYGKDRLSILQHMWIPKWDANGNEIKDLQCAKASVQEIKS